MEVFEAADKVAAVAIAEALLIATVAGGTERKGAADADLLYTKLPEGRALGSGKWDGCCGKRESGIGSRESGGGKRKDERGQADRQSGKTETDGARGRQIQWGGRTNGRTDNCV